MALNCNWIGKLYWKITYKTSGWIVFERMNESINEWMNDWMKEQKSKSTMNKKFSIRKNSSYHEEHR